MPANSNNPGKLIFVLLLVLLCGTSLTLVWTLSNIPRQVEQRFGPPASTLSWFERMSYGGQLLLYEDDLLNQIVNSGATREFEVTPGESANMVAFRLAEEGFISNADAFRVYLVYTGLDTSIQAGNYKIEPGLNAVDIARSLQDATPSEVIFGVLPGWRAEEIAIALLYSGLNISQETFLNIVYQPAETSLPEKWRQYPSLEGFLLPGEYLVSRDITAQKLVEMMLTAFDEQVTEDMRLRYTEMGLDIRDAVIFASIVQKEAVIEREQPIIASVFYNRLFQQMKLDSDPTVQYAIGFQRETGMWWKNPLTSADLSVDSPYNTYRNIGLPPGPICNPSLSVLQAVAYPAETPYFYFRAKCDQSGQHSFSVTYDEHLQNACP